MVVIRVSSVLYPYEVGAKRKSGYRTPVRTVSGVRQYVEMLFRTGYRGRREILGREGLEADGRFVSEVSSGRNFIRKARLSSLSEIEGASMSFGRR